jgi:signal transduction histidine kinase
MLRRCRQEAGSAVKELLRRIGARVKATNMATRAAVLSGLLFGLGLVVVTVYALGVFEARYLQLVGDRQYELVRAHAARLDDKLSTAQAVLAGVARTTEPAHLADARALQHSLDTRVFLHVSFDRGIRVYDRAGRLVAQSPSGRAMPLPAAQEAWLDAHAGRASVPQVSPPFGLALEAPAASAVPASEPSPAAQPRPQPALLMSAPILDAQGQVLGTMVGGLSPLARHYAAGMPDYRVGQGGYLFLTTGDRVMLMHPDPARVLKVAAAPGRNMGYDQAIDQRLQGTAQTVNTVGLPVLVSYARLPFLDWVLGANFPLSEARQPFNEALDALRWPLVLVALLLTLAVGATVHRLMRPIRRLGHHLLEVGEGRAQAFEVPSAGDVGVLARAYNRMLAMLESSEAARRESEARIVQANEALERRVLERTETIERANAELSEMLERNAQMQAELLQSEKLAALGRLVAGLGHELGTPVGSALMVSSAMERMAGDFRARLADGAPPGALELARFAAHCHESSQLVARNLGQAERLVSSFKQSAQDQIAERRRGFDLRQTVEEVVATLEHLLKGRPLRLHLSLAPDIEMDSYPGALGQALANMFVNATVHAFGPEQPGDIWISTRWEGREHVRLEVRDNGRGIDAQRLGKVFDPFFTTRRSQGARGLGLYIAFNAVTGPLRGRIEVRSDLGAGTTFIITVPRLLGDARAVGAP